MPKHSSMATNLLRQKTILLVLLCILSTFSTLLAAIEVIDDEGSIVQLTTPAERIVSLAPSLTGLLFAAGAGEKIVGVVEYSDYPEAAKLIPIIGRFDMLDMERIIELGPDLVVAWQTGNPRASYIRIRLNF